MDKQFDTSRYLREGWELLTANFANLLVASLITVAVYSAAVSIIPFVGGMIVSGPLMGGMFYVILDASRGKEFNAMRVFDGFKLKFVPLVLVGILISIFVIPGFMLFILPGFLVAGWYLFPYLFVIEKDMDFWPAMEASREIGFKNHMQVFFFAIVISVIILVGLLALVVGVLVAIPFTLCATVKAYEDMVEPSQASLNSHGADDVPPPPPPIPPPTPTTPV